MPKRAHITGCIPVYYWRHIISNARKRNIDLIISKDDCYSILERQEFRCALSNKDIRISTSSAEHDEGETTASLDAIDSSRPYEVGNVQWLHKDVNIMKHSFTQEYFLSLCREITHRDDQLK
jgi:hypothetical protein